MSLSVNFQSLAFSAVSRMKPRNEPYTDFKHGGATYYVTGDEYRKYLPAFQLAENTPRSLERDSNNPRVQAEQALSALKDCLIAACRFGAITRKRPHNESFTEFKYGNYTYYATDEHHRQFQQAQRDLVKAETTYEPRDVSESHGWTGIEQGRHSKHTRHYIRAEQHIRDLKANFAREYRPER